MRSVVVVVVVVVVFGLLASCRKEPGLDDRTDTDPATPFAVTVRGKRTLLPYARAVIIDNELQVALSSTPIECTKPDEMPRAFSGTQVRLRRARGFGNFFEHPIQPPTSIMVCSPRCVEDVFTTHLALHDQDKPPYSWLEFVPRPGLFEIEGHNRVELCPSNEPAVSLPAFDESNDVTRAMIDGNAVPIAHAIVWRSSGVEGIDRLAFYSKTPEDCAEASGWVPVVGVRWVGDAAALALPLPAQATGTDEGNSAAIELRTTGAHYSGRVVVATKRVSLNGGFSADVCVLPGTDRALATSYDLAVGSKTHTLRYALGVIEDGELEIAFSDQPLVCDPNGPVPIRDDAHTIETSIPSGLGDYYTGTPLVRRTSLVVRSEDSPRRSLLGTITVDELADSYVRVTAAVDGELPEGERTRFSASTAVPLCRRREREAVPLAPAARQPLTAVAAIDAKDMLVMWFGPNITCETRADAAHELEMRSPVRLGRQPADYNEDPSTRGASDNADLQIDAIDRTANRLRGSVSARADSTEKTPMSGTFDAAICTSP